MKPKARLVPSLMVAALLVSCGESPTPPTPPARCDVSQAQTSSNPASTEPSPPAGSPFHQLVDDFAGPAVNFNRWAPYEPLTQQQTTQDDRLVVSVTPNNRDYSGLVYRLPQRFAGSAFFAEVSQVASGGANVETVVGITSEEQDEYILLTSFGGNLQAVYHWIDQDCNDPAHRRTAFGIPYCELGSVSLDAVAHRFRRLREDNGTVHLELSADGTTWTRPAGWSLVQRFQDAGALHGLLAAGTPSPYQTTAGAHFENVNTALPAIPGGLAASCPSDNGVQLAWERRSVNETGFRIERRTGSGQFAQIGTVGAGVVEFRDAHAPGGATYEYRIRAAGAGGTSGSSRTVTVAR